MESHGESHENSHGRSHGECHEESLRSKGYMHPCQMGPYRLKKYQNALIKFGHGF